MSENFGRKYKLKSRKTIELLFKEGTQLRSYPFLVYLKAVDLPEGIPFQFVFAAPKRQFKKAHDRNYVKRLMFECFRKKKLILEELLQKEQKQFALFVIYTQRELPVYADLMQSTEKVMHKINTLISNEK